MCVFNKQMHEKLYSGDIIVTYIYCIASSLFIYFICVRVRDANCKDTFSLIAKYFFSII